MWASWGSGVTRVSMPIMKTVFFASIAVCMLAVACGDDTSASGGSSSGGNGGVGPSSGGAADGAGGAGTEGGAPSTGGSGGEGPVDPCATALFCETFDGYADVTHIADDQELGPWRAALN